jgi:hypothetical protein
VVSQIFLGRPTVNLGYSLNVETLNQYNLATNTSSSGIN